MVRMHPCQDFLFDARPIRQGSSASRTVSRRPSRATLSHATPYQRAATPRRTRSQRRATTPRVIAAAPAQSQIAASNAPAMRTVRGDSALRGIVRYGPVGGSIDGARQLMGSTGVPAPTELDSPPSMTTQAPRGGMNESRG